MTLDLEYLDHLPYLSSLEWYWFSKCSPSHRGHSGVLGSKPQNFTVTGLQQALTVCPAKLQTKSRGDQPLATGIPSLGSFWSGERRMKDRQIDRFPAAESSKTVIAAQTPASSPDAFLSTSFLP